ncbi:hypothetical protein E1A91_D12G125400v1 [Gossypium mustelinum]|uniref:Uncharacterized protein n=1 Tax=Gossypium mustelinum TaxID=34275 RepID=A0A5D2SFZ9_GOSMU|nr:hypothetical protein E1A91_D12G125400v1 [Gossypium mustelinum]
MNLELFLCLCLSLPFHFYFGFRSMFFFTSISVGSFLCPFFVAIFVTLASSETDFR